MHSYSLDTDIRRKVYYALAVIAFAVPSSFSYLTGWALPGATIVYPFSVAATYGILFWSFNRWAWSWLHRFLGVPNLNGSWLADGVSSYPDPETGGPTKFSMGYTIKQTFTKLEVFGETEQSTSRSKMASFELNHAVPIFRYSFENTPKNMADLELQRHPGLIELRINSHAEMHGDYFSGKHRLRFGELIFRRK